MKSKFTPTRQISGPWLENLKKIEKLCNLHGANLIFFKCYVKECL
jgi:hypothetical protein